MKLVMSISDFGMTDSITDCAMKAIRTGYFTDVMYMSNNPSSIRAAELIKNYPKVSVSQEINLCSGIPVTEPRQIPSLVNKDGRFLTSRERYMTGKMINYEDAYLEIENQFKLMKNRFMKNPASAMIHSYSDQNALCAFNEITAKYGIPSLMNFNDDISETKITHISNEIVLPLAKTWWTVSPKGDVDISSLDFQSNIDIMSEVQKDGWKLLCHDKAVVFTHCGYCDGELMKLSSCNLIRGKELEAFCSEEFADWLKANHIELINMNELIDTYSTFTPAKPM